MGDMSERSESLKLYKENCFDMIRSEMVRHLKDLSSRGKKLPVSFSGIFRDEHIAFVDSIEEVLSLDLNKYLQRYAVLVLPEIFERLRTEPPEGLATYGDLIDYIFSEHVDTREYIKSGDIDKGEIWDAMYYITHTWIKDRLDCEIDLDKRG